MALEIIPNQPVLFRPAGWREPCPCDDCVDCMMLANGDDLYAQVKMTPCGDELICGPLTLGEELVTNGTFTGGFTGWSLGAGWTFVPDKVCNTGSNPNSVSQTIAGLTPGQSYLVAFEISDYVAAATSLLDVFLGGTALAGNGFNADGIYSEVVIAGAGTDIDFTSATEFEGCIDNVSVRAFAPCWTAVDVDPEAEYTLTEDLACISGTLTFVSTVAGAVTGGAVRYAVSFTISNYVSGSVDVQFGSGNTPEGGYNSNGEKFAFDFFITDTNLAFVFNNFIGCISDISIKLLQPPVFYAVNQDTGEIINLGTALLTFYEDRIIFKLPMDDETVLSYGCWRLCLLNRCGITGDELLENGDFEAGTSGWQFGNGWVVNHGVAEYTDNGVSAILSQTLEAEHTMCVSVEVSAVQGELHFQLINGATTVDSMIITAPGVYALCGLATKVQFVASGGSGNRYAIDNVSAFEIEDCSECAAWCSNCIKYAEEFESCVLLIESYNDENGSWNFVWNNAAGTNIFKLSQRVPSKLEAPTYPEESNDYTFSDGTTKDTFAQSDKFWNLGIDPTTERTHDVIRLQKRSDNLIITDINESRSMWAEKGDYSPSDWVGCISPASFKVKLKTSTLYNNLCTE